MTMAGEGRAYRGDAGICQPPQSFPRKRESRCSCRLWSKAAGPPRSRGWRSWP